MPFQVACISPPVFVKVLNAVPILPIWLMLYTILTILPISAKTPTNVPTPKAIGMTFFQFIPLILEARLPVPSSSLLKNSGIFLVNRSEKKFLTFSQAALSFSLTSSYQVPPDRFSIKRLKKFPSSLVSMLKKSEIAVFIRSPKLLTEVTAGSKNFLTLAQASFNLSEALTLSITPLAHSLIVVIAVGM